MVVVVVSGTRYSVRGRVWRLEGEEWSELLDLFLRRLDPSFLCLLLRFLLFFFLCLRLRLRLDLCLREGLGDREDGR